MYDEILKASSLLDWTHSRITQGTTIEYHIPEHESRGGIVKTCLIHVGSLTDLSFSSDDLVLIDKNLLHFTTEINLDHAEMRQLESDEKILKTINSANSLLKTVSVKNYNRIISIGGGVIINVSAYIAEKLGIPHIIFPTTIISMCDGSIGGKVRLNDTKDVVVTKHAYKSVYQPHEIIIDPQFINNISDDTVRIGLAEIIKHAMYQSPRLYGYLISDAFSPFSRKEDLLRAILWTADLKRVLAEVDPMESNEGARKILRAAHETSDQIEIAHDFKISHGAALLNAMITDLSRDKEKSQKLKTLYDKLKINLKTLY
jgi:3-dehydroquinate synthase